MANEKVELLDASKHQNTKIIINEYDDPMFAVNAANVVVQELNQLVLEYPIFITQSPQSKEYQLTALLGLNSGQNSFIKNKRWHAKFLPLDILRRPFALILKEDSFEGEGVIALDKSSSKINESEGQAIFNEDNSPSKYLERIQATFSELMKGTQQVRKIMQVATKFDLIEPISIEYQIKGESFIREDLLGFSEEKINDLEPTSLKECLDLGLLKVCHQLQLSHQHIDKLIQD